MQEEVFIRRFYKENIRITASVFLSDIAVGVFQLLMKNHIGLKTKSQISIFVNFV